MLSFFRACPCGTPEFFVWERKPSAYTCFAKTGKVCRKGVWSVICDFFASMYSAGNILCLPAIFISYTGASPDAKTPLLRSMDAVNCQALRLLRLFGDTETAKVTPFVCPEQECFLVD